MKLAFLFLFPFLALALSEENPYEKDLPAFDVGFYEAVPRSVVGHVNACPEGLLVFRKNNDQNQLWLGDGFYLDQINTGEVRREFDGVGNCYDMINVLTNKNKITKMVSRYCKESEKDSTFKKTYEGKTQLSFRKEQVSFLYEYSVTGAAGLEKKTISKCELRKYLKLKTSK